MPNGTNYEDSYNNSYSTLCNYSGATYLPLCSSGRVILPTFNAGVGYQTGYVGTTSHSGHSYGMLGSVYSDSCACVPQNNRCQPMSDYQQMPQQVIVKGGCSCSD